LVHPHIQVAFEAKGEAAGGFIELVTADTEIGEDTVHGRDFMQPQKSSQVAKVMRQEFDAAVIGKVSPRIFILIEGEEPAARSQSGEDPP
jgi:hypothetical protein